MNRVISKFKHSFRRAHKVRATVRGTAERPRLSVSVSNKNISAQIIDDEASKTLVSASTITIKDATGSLSVQAALIGEEIAKRALKKKIKQVAFDRGPRKYHGRIKALADAARKAGLEF